MEIGPLEHAADDPVRTTIDDATANLLGLTPETVAEWRKRLESNGEPAAPACIDPAPSTPICRSSATPWPSTPASAPPASGVAVGTESAETRSFAMASDDPPIKAMNGPAMTSYASFTDIFPRKIRNAKIRKA